jgi:hypothetical protein
MSELPPDIPPNTPYVRGLDSRLRERIICPVCRRRASRYWSSPTMEYKCNECQTPMRALTSAEWVSEWRKGGAARAVAPEPIVAEEPRPTAAKGESPGLFGALWRGLTRKKFAHITT